MGAVTSRESARSEVDLQLRVKQMTWEAQGVVSLLLENADGSPLPAWTPGSHLDLHLPGGLTRNYSLCGDPADLSSWLVGVLREPAGRGGSAYVHDHLRVGDELSARGPRNNFALIEAPSYQFVAGGIGITPILPMIRGAEDAGTPWKLLYGGRSRASMAFLERLAEYGDRVTVWPQDESGLLPLADILAQTPADARVYSCGPPPLLAALDELMADRPEGSLVVERFTAAPTAEPASSENDGTFEVEARRSGVTVTVPPGSSILSCLEGAGIFVPNSCREGICGTCETSVIEGVVDHRDSLLSDQERESMKTLMVCVSRSVSPRLILDA